MGSPMKMLRSPNESTGSNLMDNSLLNIFVPLSCTASSTKFPSRCMKSPINTRLNSFSEDRISDIGDNILRHSLISQNSLKDKLSESPNKRLNTSNEDRISESPNKWLSTSNEDRISDRENDCGHHPLIQQSSLEDKISDLPEDCLHQIFADLDMRTVMRSSIFSRRWKYVWSYLPYLNFTNSTIGNSNAKARTARFMNFVENVLHLRDDNSIVQSFCLNYKFSLDGTRVAKWIQYAAMHGVEKLRLCLFTEDDDAVELPECIFETVKFLELTSICGIFLRLILPNTFSLCQLQVVHLESVTVENAEQIGEMLTNCPLLETLVLRRCKLESNVFYVSSPSLRKFQFNHLNIDPLEVIKICAPNLSSLEMSGKFSKFYVENLTSLVKAQISLRDSRLLKASSVEVICKPAVLENLRCLKVIIFFHGPYIRAMANLLKNSPNIETLLVQSVESGECYPNWKSDFSELEGILDHLKTVELMDFQASYDEVEFLKTLLSCALVLEEIVLKVSKRSIREVKNRARQSFPKTKLVLMKFVIVQ